MPQTVEGSSADHLVGGERLSPFAEVQIRGQHRGGTLIALSDQVMEVLVFGERSGLSPKSLQMSSGTLTN